MKQKTTGHLNKAQRWVLKFIKDTRLKGEDLVGSLYWELDKKFEGKKVPPEYVKAYDEVIHTIQALKGR
jgi:hypothetical protein